MSAAATEDNSPRAGSCGSIWLTIAKPQSIFNTFILNYIASSNRAPSPPTLPISSPIPYQQRPDMNDLRPIITMMQEQELGKVIITLAVPIAAAVLISGNGTKLMVAHVVAVGLVMGCMATWNAILFRTSFPRLANVLEQVGISLVLLLLYGLAASFVPIGLSWIMWFSGASCLAPFIVSRFYSTQSS